MEFKQGQKVKFDGKETYIEVLHDDKTCNIQNPEWDWDMEAECVANNVEYNVPYWITVNLSEVSGL